MKTSMDATVLDIFESLSEVFSGKAKLGLMHGRMSSEEKERAMFDFEANTTQILVSTTVIEVGVNVVNACCMVIYDAPFRSVAAFISCAAGLRGRRQGYCFC